MAKTFDKAKWQEDSKARVEKAQAQLTEGLAKLQSSDEWKGMLANMARIGPATIMRFSFRNALLVMLQRPGAAHAATFAAWQNLGRQVRKGEKALTVLRPVFAKREKGQPVDAQDPEAQRLVGFRPLPVFAVAQTDGAPLVPPTPPDLSSPEAFERSVEVLREVALGLAGAPVSSVTLRPRTAADPANARGWYEVATRAIVVVTDETNRAMQFRTLCHEVAHALLHPEGAPHQAPEREVEAESTAFVVCSALGLDTADVSFPYVAGWAGTEDAAAAVARSGQRIFTAAQTLLGALVPAADAEEAAEAA